MEPENKVDSFLSVYKYPLAIGLVGLVLLIGGAINSGVFKSFSSKHPPVAVNSANFSSSVISVDVSGAVATPGVYKLTNGARVEDALKSAGGISVTADPEYVAKYVNLAQKITDGMKIYIPTLATSTSVAGVSAQPEGATNINTAPLSALDQLPGVGPVSAQKIIDNRPYSETAELLSKKILSKSTYDKVKALVSVY